MGKANVTERGGVLTSNNSSDSPTGSGYNTDVSDDNLPCDRTSPSSDLNGNSVSDEQVGEFLIIIMLWKNNLSMTYSQEAKMSNTTFAAWSIGKGISIKFPSNLVGRAPRRCC